MKKNKKEVNSFKKDILAIFLITLGFLLFIFTTNINSGFIGNYIGDILKSLFGIITFLIPFLFFIFGLGHFIHNNFLSNYKNYIFFIGNFILLLLLVSLLNISNIKDVFLDINSFSDYIEYFLNQDLELYGGLIGSFFSYIIVNLIGVLSFYVIIVLLFFINILYYFNISPKLIFKKCSIFFKNTYEFINKKLSEVFNNIKKKSRDRDIQRKIKKEKKLEKKLEKERKFKEEIEKKEKVLIKSETEISNKEIKNLNIKSNYINHYLIKEEDKKREIILIGLLDKKHFLNKKKYDNINREDKKININRNGFKIKDKEKFKRLRDRLNNEVEKINEEKTIDLEKPQNKSTILEKQREIDKIDLENSSNYLKKEIKEYKYPSLNLLNEKEIDLNEGSEEIYNKSQVLEETLESFGVKASVTKVTKGPSITRYELQPERGVKVSKVVNLSDDIALNMEASAIRIEAPIPGKAAVGIEIPNKNMEMVTLSEIFSAEKFKKSDLNIPFALGKDVAGEEIITDITKMPHLLIAGATGSGKSVCINTLILSMIYSLPPEKLNLLLIDPKVVELNQYNGLPHLLAPVVTDPKKATLSLSWAVEEMERRYKLFAENNTKNISGYNQLDDKANIPYIVIIIDELADLMMVASKEVEEKVCRLAQMARAAGIHLIIATQRPSVNIITGVIKANIPSRIAFSVTSQIDSRTIIDISGAEKLMGKGDMLFSPMGSNKPIRIQGAFVDEKEVNRVVEEINNQNIKLIGSKENEINEMENSIKNNLIEKLESDIQEESTDNKDSKIQEIKEYLKGEDKISISKLQREFSLGYNKAAKIMKILEDEGIVGPHNGSKPRKVL